jgi:hypothetical protein
LNPGTLGLIANTLTTILQRATTTNLKKLLNYGFKKIIAFWDMKLEVKTAAVVLDSLITQVPTFDKSILQ